MKRRLLLIVVALVGILWGKSGQIHAATPLPGETYSYNFADGSVFPEDITIYYDTFTSSDGILTINKGTGSQFRYHNTHGITITSGNSLNMVVAGNATINFGSCHYSVPGGVFVITDEAGEELGRVDAQPTSCSIVSFNYKGDAGVITATLSSDAGSSYFHSISIINDAETVAALPGKTYSYDFTNGSVFPEDDSIYYDTFTSSDGILTINRGTGGQFRYYNTHGLILSSGNTLEFIVAGNALISFGNCMYSPVNAVFALTDSSGKFLGEVKAFSEGACSPEIFSYVGEAGVITATLSDHGSVYFHSLTIENEPEIVSSDKIDVWDFGAAQLDEEIYVNRLTEDIINSWYPGVEPGTESKDIEFIGEFTVGVLSYIGATGDRIRTSNENLSRYDSNGSPATFEGETFTGNLYVNAEAAASRYMSLTLSADDEVALYVKTQSGKGKLTFEYMGDATQKDVADVGGSLELVKFVAKKEVLIAFMIRLISLSTTGF